MAVWHTLAQLRHVNYQQVAQNEKLISIYLVVRTVFYHNSKILRPTYVSHCSGHQGFVSTMQYVYVAQGVDGNSEVQKVTYETVFYLKSTSHHVFPKDRKRTRSSQKTAEKRRISGILVLLRSFRSISVSVSNICHYDPLVKWRMTAFLKPRTMR